MTRNEKQDYLREKRKNRALEKAKKLLLRLNSSDEELELHNKYLMKHLDNFKIDEIALEIQETDEEELIRNKILARDLHDIAMENHLFGLIHQSIIEALEKTELGGLAPVLSIINKNLNTEKSMILGKLAEIENYYLHEKEKNENSKTNIELRKIAEGFKNLHAKKDMKSVIYGREGGKKIRYDIYYKTSEEIIKNYKGDLNRRGVIGNLVILTNEEIIRNEDNSKIPSDRQCRTIIKKHIAELNNQ